MTSRCNRFTGECEGGCKAGWKEPTCDTSKRRSMCLMIETFDKNAIFFIHAKTNKRFLKKILSNSSVFLIIFIEFFFVLVYYFLKFMCTFTPFQTSFGTFFRYINHLYVLIAQVTSLFFVVITSVYLLEL